MKTSAILLTGFVIASAAMSAPNDKMAEQRYRMKYGRPSPAEEARKATRTSDNEYAPQACCRTLHASPVSTALAADRSGQEARYLVKFGRLTPLAEARKQKSELELAAHIQNCVELGKCARMRPVEAGTALVPTDTERRLQAKYGITPTAPRRGETPKHEHDLVASVDLGGCDHECCKHAE